MTVTVVHFNNLAWESALGIEVSREPPFKVLDGVMYVTFIYQNGTKREMHSPKDFWVPGRNLAYFKIDFDIWKIKTVDAKFIADTEPLNLDQIVVLKSSPSGWIDRYFCGEKRPFLMTNGTWFTLTDKC